MKKFMFAAIAALTLTVGALTGVANAAQSQTQSRQAPTWADYGLSGGGG